MYYRANVLPGDSFTKSLDLVQGAIGMEVGTGGQPASSLRMLVRGIVVGDHMDRGRGTEASMWPTGVDFRHRWRMSERDQLVPLGRRQRSGSTKGKVHP
jgi:hypothetical protein